jgi:hypothetical protein
MVAALISAYGKPVSRVEIDRAFDPLVTIPVVGFDRTDQPDPAKSCAIAASAMDRYGDVDAPQALRLGIGDLLSAMSAEEDRIKSVRAEILEGQIHAKSEAIRIREAMDHYAPRGVAFRVVNKAGRYAPTILLEAANVVDHPITAFLLKIRLASPDGIVIGSGSVKFVPPVPLGPGVQTEYVVDLSGVRGIDDPSVLTYSGAVRVVIGLDDLFVEGQPMLQRLTVSASDHSRIDVLAVLHSTVLRFRDTIRGIRLREGAALG